MIEATQIVQDARAGYACDGCTTRQPMALNEVKSCCKGHSTLGQILDECLQRQGITSCYPHYVSRFW